MLIKIHTKKNARIVALLMAAVMAFTIYGGAGNLVAYAGSEGGESPQASGQASIQAEAPTTPQLRVTSVEVLNHGEVQSIYRDAVYKGDADKGEDPNKWYTTYREINLRDPRIFNLEYTVDADTVEGYASDTNTSGTAMDAYLEKVSLKYGGYDLDKWGDTRTLRGDNPILVMGEKSIDENKDGSYTVSIALETKSAWPVPTDRKGEPLGKNPNTNTPYDGYYSGRQFDFGVGQSADNRDWWQAGPAKEGCGTYALTAIVEDEAVATTDLHIGPYDEMKSWIEINQFAQSLVKAIEGEEISISELDSRPTGTVAEGYVGLDEKGNPVAGERTNNVYVEVSILGYGLTDNYKPENSSFNNYSRYNPIWNIAVAKDEDTVDTYLNETKVKMNENPQELIDRYKNADDEDVDMVSVYYQNNVHSDEVTGTETMIKLIMDLVAGGKEGSEINYRTWELDDMEFRYRDAAEGATTGETHHVKGDYDGIFAEKSQRVDKTIDTGEALDKLIFVSTLCSNPDGKAGMRRTNRYAFDLNRDAVFSTMPESIAIVKDLMKWDPLVMNEWHGYVQQMLIEPCTAPHDPTYDYDLLQNNMLNLAYAAGMAVTASSGCSNFTVPWDHYDGGDWDDGGTIYAPMFAELLGTYGFTIEFPYANSDSFDANNAVNYGMIDELLHGETNFFNGNRLNGELMDVEGNVYDSHQVDIKYDTMRKSTILSKLTTKLRGLNNEDVKDKVDKYFIDKKQVSGSEKVEDRVVGRPRPVDASGNELPYFPDYIVIPADEENQYNIAEGIKAMNQMMGWDIKVDVSTEAVKYNGKTIDAGAYVINMKQAYRNVIFEVMGKGYDATNFSSMYADIYCNLPDVRGFDSIQVYGEEIFEDKLEAQEEAIEKIADISGTPDEYVVFKSQSTDAVRFVNLLLSGKSSGPSTSEKGAVWMLRKDAENVGEASDYIIKEEDLEKINNLQDNSDLGLQGCQIVGKYIEELPEEAVKLVEPIIQLNTLRTAQTGGPLWWMLDDYLGFGSMTDYNGSNTLRDGANVVISNSAGSLDPTILNGIKEDKLGVIFIRNANPLNEENFGTGIKAPETVSYTDIAINGKYNVDDSLFTANYENTSTYYARGYGYTTIPEGSKVLFKSDADPAKAFIGGFQATKGNKSIFADTTTIFSTILDGEGIEGRPIQSLTIGQRLDYRSHYQKLLPLLATAIYAGAAGIYDDMNDPVISEIENDGNKIIFSATEKTGESGVKELTVYKINGNKEVLVGKSQQDELIIRAPKEKTQEFKLVAVDYAGNETEKVLTYKFTPSTPSDPSGPVTPTTPTISTDSDGNGVNDTNGGTAAFDPATGKLTITPAKGFEVAGVTVNGVSKGNATELTGIRATDTIKITFKQISQDPGKTPEQIEADRLAKIVAGVKATRIIYPNAVKYNKSKVKLTWKKTKGYKVDYYSIYRANSKDGKYKEVFKSKTLRFITSKNLKKGKTVYFKVVGVRKVGDKLIKTKFSRVESIKIR